jgi:hypothetical protein
MKYADVAENVRHLLDDRPSQDEFIYELLLAYGKPKASITRLKQGTYNQSKVPGEVLWKKELYFKAVFTTEDTEKGLTTEGTKGHRGKASCSSESSSAAGGEENILYAEIEALKKAKGTKAHNPRFLFVTDFEQILALDRKTNDTLDIKFQGLETHFDFFLPWAGMEKTKLSNENPADIKAAEKMAKLFDAIKLDNPRYMREDAHSMNVFLGRLLFCLFAEDTGIFPENAVTNAIASHTAVDGSDLDAFFKQLFDWLDTPDNKRKLTTEGTENHRGEASCSSVSSSAAGGKNSFLSSMQGLPYVNGGLFREHFDIPEFSAKSRRMIIESGSLNWSEINPDIFGSMFQAVIDPEERHNLGQHYTSVTNIMKVIEPLFLNDFKADLEKASNLTKGKKQALQRLLDRIAKVKIFDPACGSGNFLIIAYKELRKLEMEVFRELQAIEGAFPISGMNVNQFYGIEIADFACETAILALWLAEHQMNLEYKKIFGQTLVSLPLKEGANINCGNATHVEWDSICPIKDGDEVYVLGNPPYLGGKYQSKEQKSDMKLVFAPNKNFKQLDYIACWFMKASRYIRAGGKFAFVTTSSINQGAQVEQLWPLIFALDLEIFFAYKPFAWTNNAKSNAGVTCSIVGVRKKCTDEKILFGKALRRSVDTINAYLVNGTNTIVVKQSDPISAIPPIITGNSPYEGGNLILSKTDVDDLVNQYPEVQGFIKRLYGAREFLNGLERWCLWIREDQRKEALQILPIKERVNRSLEFRKNGGDVARGLVDRPHQFRYTHTAIESQIILPRVSSERREYIPFGFLSKDCIISDSAQAIYDPEPWILGIISTKIHMAWMRITCGRLKTDYRYSSGMCYNTFPIPNLTDKQKEIITMHLAEVLEERENHSQKTMAQLYDPNKMPDGLREAHHNLDLAVDRIYRAKPFTSDEERLEHLFKLYEEMTAKEKLV